MSKKDCFDNIHQNPDKGAFCLFLSNTLKTHVDCQTKLFRPNLSLTFWHVDESYSLYYKQSLVGMQSLLKTQLYLESILKEGAVCVYVIVFVFTRIL